MWDVDNFSVLTENVETKDFSKWQAIKRIYLSELKGAGIGFTGKDVCDKLTLPDKLNLKNIGLSWIQMSRAVFFVQEKGWNFYVGSDKRIYRSGYDGSCGGN